MLGIIKFMQASKVLVNPRLAAFQNVPNLVENYSKKSVEEKLGLPPKPKKPLTPYFRYLVEIRPKVLTENPKLSACEIAREVGKRWKDADEALKNNFIADFMKEKETYKKMNASYDSSLTQDQRDKIANLRRQITEKKEKLAHRKKNRDNQKPKKPPSGFIRFLSEVFANEKRGSTDLTNYRRNIAQRWVELPEEKKKVYNDAYKKDMDKYKKELSSWESKMISLGNTDLVRSVTPNPVDVETKRRLKKTGSK